MVQLAQHCNRCNKPIDNADADATFTAGFYNVTGSGWSRFGRPGEVVVCDCCMWADPEYIKIYGQQNMDGCTNGV